MTPQESLSKGPGRGRNAYLQICRDVAGWLTELRELVPPEFSAVNYQPQLVRLTEVERQIDFGVMRIAAVLERIDRPETALKLRLGVQSLGQLTTECVACTDAESAEERGRLRQMLVLSAVDLERLLRQCAAEIEAAGVEAEKTKLEGGGGGGGQRKATVNARMLETIQSNTDAIGWNSRQWAEHLKCGKSTVVETPTWENLKMGRERKKAERAKDRRRRARASDRRRG